MTRCEALGSLEDFLLECEDPPGLSPHVLRWRREEEEQEEERINFFKAKE